MELFFQWLFRTSGQAAVLIILVLLAQWLFGEWLKPRWRYCLWWLVLVRLLLPVTLESRLSLFNGHRYVLAGLERLTGKHAVLTVAGHPLSAPNPRTRRNAPDGRSAQSAGTEVSVASTDSPPGSVFPPQSSVGIRSPSSNQPPATSIFRQLLPTLWLAGALILGLRLFWQNYRFWQRLRPQPLVPNAKVLQLLGDCQQAMSVRTRLELLETPAVSSPALYGLFRRRLLLPPNLIERFTLPELRYVFLHELAHLRRRDMLVNWLMAVLQVLHWFNPLVWLAFHRLGADRELACDELALLAAREGETQAYGQTIIKLLEGFVSPAAVPGLAGILENRNQMERRIRMIAKFRRSNRWPVLALAVFASLAALTLTDAQTKSVPLRGTDDQSPGGGAGKKPRTSDLALQPPGAVAQEGVLVDTKTGVQFTRIKAMVAAENDGACVSASANGKFLLGDGRILPLDGSTPFDMVEMPNARGGSWSPDGQQLAFATTNAMWVVPVNLETGRASETPRKLFDGVACWGALSGTCPITWSSDSTKTAFVFEDKAGVFHDSTCAVAEGRVGDGIDPVAFGVRSPDGKTVAFTYAIGTNYDRVNEAGIWVKSVGASKPRKISDWGHPVCWSKDSQWLIASRFASTYRSLTAEYPKLLFVHLGSGRQVTVTPPTSSRFSGLARSTGKLRFYRPSFGIAVAYNVVAASGGAPAELGWKIKSMFVVWDSQFWTPDSRIMLARGFVEKEGEDSDQLFWAMPLSGDDPYKVEIHTQIPGKPYPLSLCPDCTKVLLLEGLGSNTANLWVAPVSVRKGRTTGPAVIVFKRQRGESFYCWSPDGTKIAFVHETNIWFVSASGGEPKHLTRTAPATAWIAPLWSPWSPDGMKIGYLTSTNGFEEAVLHVVSATGGEPESLRAGGMAGRLAWLADSQQIVLSSSDGELLAIPIAGGKSRLIAKSKDLGVDDIDDICCAPDGQSLALIGITKDSQNLYTLSLEAGAMPKILASVPKDGWLRELRWSPDGKWLSYCSMLPGKVRPQGVLWELDVEATVAKLSK